MRYLSVCSGIEAATVAWEPLGWTPVAFAEIEPFPSRVLAHHWPDTPNLGDFTAINVAALGPVDLLVGGTPCQAFSIAGKRGSLADARGNLSLGFAVLAHDLVRSCGARWALWENVPGILSTRDNAFGCFLCALVGGDAPLVPPDAMWGPKPVFDLGRYDVHRTFGWQSCRWPCQGLVAGPRARAAWRVLDAQYFGLAQRRERLFVVVGFGDGADPAAVLFEPQGLRRHPPPRGESGEGFTQDFAQSLTASGRGVERTGESRGQDALVAFGGNNTAGPIDVAAALNAHGGPNGRQDFESETFIAHTLRGEGFDASEDGTGRGTPIVPICFDCKAGGDTNFSIGELPGSLCGAGHGGGHAAIAFGISSDCFDRSGEGIGQTAGERSGLGITEEISQTLKAKGPNAVATPYAVRRLTPTECHRLQGFPDSHAQIPGAADGPIYKAIGNSYPVPVIAWLGRRFDAVDARGNTTATFNSVLIAEAAAE